MDIQDNPCHAPAGTPHLKAPAPVQAEINLICEGRDARTGTSLLPRRNQPPGAGPHTNRIDARSRRPEVNQGPRRRPHSGNRLSPQNAGINRLPPGNVPYAGPSPQTRGSTQNVPLNGAFMTPIPANAGTNLGRHYRIWRQPPIPAHAGINPAGDAAHNGSIPRTHRGSTRVDVA